MSNAEFNEDRHVNETDTTRASSACAQQCREQMTNSCMY